jgi:ATP-dependent Clp protease ATP-binding subunit ClpC
VSIGLFVAGIALGLIIGRLWFRRADGDGSDTARGRVERTRAEAGRDADASALPAPGDAATASRESQAAQQAADGINASADAATNISATSGEATGDAANAAPGESPRDRLYRLRREVDQQDGGVQHPDDLLRIAEFREGAALLATAAFTAADVIEALGSPGYAAPCMAALALRERSDVDARAALNATMPFGGYPLRFLLDWLQTQPDARALPWLLRHAREWWWDASGVRQRVRDYLRWAQANAPASGAVSAAESQAVSQLGLISESQSESHIAPHIESQTTANAASNASDAATTPTAAAASTALTAATTLIELGDLDDFALNDIETTFKQFQEPLLAPYLAAVIAELRLRREKQTLGGIGRVWSAPEQSTTVDHPELQRDLDKLHELLSAPRPKSILLSGEHGCGKTTLVDRLLARLHAEGWLLFEASAAEVLAGQTYSGELEARIRDMLAALDRKQALWRVQDFFDLLNKGSHKQDPRGILDLLLPAMERGSLLMLGELTPQQHAQLLLARPVLRHHAETVSLRSPDDAAMRDVLARWAAAREAALGRAALDALALDEAQRMAAQYFPEQHEPGRTLRLLDEALQAAISGDDARLPLDGEALLRTIALRSGLPMNVIDDRQSLDLDGLRAFFRKRVIGQDEAVECLVDRIAMLKAGLVDAARPIGVFLFAGPTGTGKTELAKTLGELLFGSSERLLRLDMSEYQSEDAAWRLTDDGRDGTRSLVARIREQPFSVVLLDEFEKAHPRVWDVFLQVFDDGRLGDRSGHVADFRHSIIILTSNVGSTITRSAGPGFTSAAGGYSRGAVEKALFETFRREFLNRLDRIVLFNPLDRGLMREILHKELQRAMQRRGLRNRDWAVEWEPSAIEFLLDRGFTPDLGARPVRRAIEQHLLAPLARSIVEHRTPQGDQFLFVRSAGERLDVEFIDPDRPAFAIARATATHANADAQDLRELIYSPETSADSLASLHAHLQYRLATVASPSWQRERDADFAAMSDRDFWSRADRFDVLDRIERRDRIESALDTAQRLDERLARDGANAVFVARHAQLLWLLDHAIAAVEDREPQDAVFVLAASGSDLKRDAAQTRLWWQQLLGMYVAWAERRNMRIESLEQDAEGCRARLAVSGFGAYRLLAEEHGLHVLEQDATDIDGGTRRYSVSVRVAHDHPGRARPTLHVADDEPRVCRRYRVAPSPLVRDAARGWRSGRLDRVLAGEFDVMRADDD